MSRPVREVVRLWKLMRDSRRPGQRAAVSSFSIAPCQGGSPCAISAWERERALAGPLLAANPTRTHLVGTVLTEPRVVLDHVAENHRGHDLQSPISSSSSPDQLSRDVQPGGNPFR